MRRFNPLVHFERITPSSSPMSASTVWPPYRLLLQDHAEDRFREIYNAVDLRIAVFVIDPRVGRGDASENAEMAEATKKAEQTLRTKRAIGLFVKPDMYGENAFIYAPDRKGTPSKVSPMTPFVLLHRMFDMCFVSIKHSMEPFTAKPARVIDQTATLNKLRRYAWKLNECAQALSDEMRSARRAAEAASAGVDTAAGRAGVLSPTDVASDLFAKWCLTGRVAYAPPASVATPTEKRYQTSVVQLTQQFPLIRDYLASLADLSGDPSSPVVVFEV